MSCHSDQTPTPHSVQNPFSPVSRNDQSIGKYRKGQSAARLLILYNTIKTLKACEVDLCLDQQAVDTTKPSGKLMLQMTVAFAESSGR
jgi:hypothetical protein